MKNNQLQLVTFEQAQRLKKAGFDWPTSGVFCGNLPTSDSGEVVMRSLQNHNGDNSNDNIMQIALMGYRICSAPTVALALKWMRDMKGMLFDVLYVRHNYSPTKQHGWRGEYRIDNQTGATTQDFETYESAESTLLDELLTIIDNQ